MATGSTIGVFFLQSQIEKQTQHAKRGATHIVPAKRHPAHQISRARAHLTHECVRKRCDVSVPPPRSAYPQPRKTTLAKPSRLRLVFTPRSTRGRVTTHGISRATCVAITRAHPPPTLFRSSSTCQMSPALSGMRKSPNCNVCGAPIRSPASGIPRSCFTILEHAIVCSRIHFTSPRIETRLLSYPYVEPIIKILIKTTNKKNLHLDINHLRSDFSAVRKVR